VGRGECDSEDCFTTSTENKCLCGLARPREPVLADRGVLDIVAGEGMAHEYVGGVGDDEGKKKGLLPRPLQVKRRRKSNWTRIGMLSLAGASMISK